MGHKDPKLMMRQNLIEKLCSPLSIQDRSLFRCTHDVRHRAFAPCQRLKYGVEDTIEVLADILPKKSQNEIPVLLLQQPVFPPITTVGFWIGEVLRAIELHDDA
jgi:hypothetical protein